MNIPTHYLVIFAEVLFTTLGLLFVLIYLYVKSDKKWQLLLHGMQDKLLDFKNRYREERARGDLVRELLHNKISALKRAEAHEEAHLAEITQLKAEIENLHQSEKLRSEIAGQLITSKAESERLSLALSEQQKTASQLQETIHTLEERIEALTRSPSANTPDGHDDDLQTNGMLELERLRARADKQQETIRKLELELMQLGYKNPLEEIAESPAADPADNQHLAQMLNESESCVEQLENELSVLQRKIDTLETSAEKESDSSDIQRLEQRLKESESCNIQLENELNAMMKKVRQLEERKPPPEEPVYYDI